MKIVSAEFLTSAVEEAGWPQEDLPELAFVGRSNVGKSSMLNRLAGKQGLARVSNTPGRTRTLNFYDLLLDRGAKKQHVRFCDLPGYGFAKVSRTERAAWAKMIEAYLTRREQLRVVVSIVDAKVGPTEDDVQTLAWLGGAARPPIVVATKLDKLPKAKRIGRLRQIEKELALPERSLVGFSSEEGFGRDELWRLLLDATS